MPVLSAGPEEHKVARLKVRPSNLGADARLPPRVAGQAQVKDVGVQRLRQAGAVHTASVGATEAVGNAIPTTRFSP
jgi:hypothetical protein